MPSTFQALAVVLVALLPGALFIWTVERLSGRWGVALADRLLRFIGVSTVFHLVAAPVTYLLWHDYLRSGVRAEDSLLPLWLWPVAGLYVWVPVALGTIVGLASKDGLLPEILTGVNPAPTAWDYVFFGNPDAWVRLKLKSGVWIGGLFTAGSYAGGFPDPADLYLSQAVEIDPETGEFERGRAGGPVFKGHGRLVRWSEVEYLDFAKR